MFNAGHWYLLSGTVSCRSSLLCSPFGHACTFYGYLYFFILPLIYLYIYLPCYAADYSQSFPSYRLRLTLASSYTSFVTYVHFTIIVSTYNRFVLSCTIVYQSFPSYQLGLYLYRSGVGAYNYFNLKIYIAGLDFDVIN